MSLNLILILQKTLQTASTKMKIIAKYNNFITMSLLLLINYRSPSRILLLNHIQYHVSSLVFNCSFGDLLTECIMAKWRRNCKRQPVSTTSKIWLFQILMTQDVQTQTGLLPSCTIDRLYSISKGAMYGELSKILDILNSGNGCLHVDNNLILISFNMESKYLINNCLALLSLKKKLSKKN